VAAERAGTSWWPGLATARECAAAAGARSVGSQHVLLALLGRDAESVATVLREAAVDRPSVLAALQGITGTGGARAEPVPVEQVSVSPRVGALLRRAAGGVAGEVTDLAVLGELLDDRGEPSVVRVVLTSLGARRRALRAYRRLTGTRVDDVDGDLVPG
jgi:ATP-dependent Clp protease ATP-binding subunit ClpA